MLCRQKYFPLFDQASWNWPIYGYVMNGRRSRHRNWGWSDYPLAMSAESAVALAAIFSAERFVLDYLVDTARRIHLLMQDILYIVHERTADLQKILTLKRYRRARPTRG